MNIEIKYIHLPFFIAILVATMGAGCSGVGTNGNNTNRTANIPVPSPSVPRTENTNVNSNTLPSNTVKRGLSAPAPTPNIGSGGEDFALFMKVKGSLASDPELASSVIVEIKGGNAVLSGNISSEDKKKRAEQIVRSTEGVRTVKNLIKVG